MSKREKKGLGAWFPSATVIKGVEFDASVKEITIVLFYCYVRPTWSEVRKEEAIAELSELGVKLNLGGRLRVAQEGINATVTGTHAEVVAFTDALKVFDESFKCVDFKFIEHMPLDRAFGELKVIAAMELSP
jgi:predicted sulfurtransferase